jgi:hypothetical protein
MNLPIALVVTVEDDYPGEPRANGGCKVYLTGQLIGHRPYDGSDTDEVAAETVQALSELLRERLGWKPEAPPEEGTWRWPEGVE